MQMQQGVKGLQPILAGLTLVSLLSLLVPSQSKGISAILSLFGTASGTAYLLKDVRQRRVQSLEYQVGLVNDERVAWETERQQMLEQFQVYKNDIAQQLEAQRQAMQAQLDERANEIRAWEQQVETQSQKVQTDLLRHETLVQTHNVEYQKLMAQLKQEIELEKQRVTQRELSLVQEYSEKETALQKKELQLTEQLAQAIKLEQARVQTELQQVTNDRELLGQERSNLLREYDSKLAELQQQQAILAKQEGDLQQELQVEFANKRQQLEEMREQTIAQLQAHFQGRWDEKVAEVEGYIDMLREANMRLTLEAEQLMHEKMWAPTSKGYPGHIANEVIRALREYDVPVFYEDCERFATGGIGVWLSHGPKVRPEDINRCAKGLESKLGIGAPKIEIDDNGFITIDFGATPKLQDVDFQKLKASKTFDGLITEPPVSLKDRALRDSVHYSVFSETGGGKTTFVNNLLSFMRAVMGKEVEVIINDLKWPDPKTQWRVRGEEVEPKYIDMKEALEGVRDMSKYVLARSTQNKQEARAKKKISIFKPSIWVTDEAHTLVSEYGRKAAGPLKFCLRLGRSLNVRVLYIGQSPQCSAYGMNKPDLLNSTRFWLGADMALAGIKELDMPIETRKRLRAEIYARQSKADEEAAAGVEHPPSKFFALVKMSGQSAFLMTLPPPYAYDGMEIEGEEPEAGFAPEPEIDLSEEDLLKLIESAADDPDGDGNSSASGERMANPIVARGLDAVFGRDEVAVIKELPKAQKLVLEYAADSLGEWVTASEVISSRNHLHKSGFKSVHVIDIFQELATKWALGEVKDFPRKVKKYRYVNLPIIVLGMARRKKAESQKGAGADAAWLDLSEIAQLPVVQEKGFKAQDIADEFEALVAQGLCERSEDERRIRHLKEV